MTNTLQIALFTCPNMLATSLSFPKELLTAAAQIARVKDRKSPDITFTTLSLHGKKDSNLAGLDLPATASLADAGHFDLAILPAIWRNPNPALKLEPKTIEGLINLYQQGTTFAATGTGTWILAETGLLEYKSATTHWYHLKAFKQRYPNLNVRDQHLITQADRIYCASSINSLADLTIYLISLLYNDDIAKAVEQQFSPEVRQSYRTRLFIDGADNVHSDELIVEAQQQIQDSLHQTVDFEQLAKQLGISQRTLNRRFVKATGISPNQYLTRLRMNTAKDLLQHSNLNIADIALAVGYSSLSLFSSSFKKQENTSPSVYRQSVKAKLFSSTEV